MTQKTGTNADPFPGCGNQGEFVGTTILYRTTEKTIPTPSAATIHADLIAAINHMLQRLETVDDHAAAIAAVYHILDAGWYAVDHRDLIRAIEGRLPRPSAYQMDAGNLRITNAQQVYTARALGAFGDIVVALTTDNPDGRPYQLRPIKCPRRGYITVPAWDLTRPKSRRANPADIIDADGKQAAGELALGRVI